MQIKYLKGHNQTVLENQFDKSELTLKQVSQIKMTKLLEKCLNANYIRTENSGDYAIEVDGNILYLLFQCSNGNEDWKNNFNFPAIAYKHGKNKWRGHKGFLKVWKSIRDSLEPQIILTLLSNRQVDTIVCVGYSHGAAIAGFATEDMEYIYDSKYSVHGVGFGCPRFTWGFLSKNVKDRFRNFLPIRNIPDIVTHVPPIILGYRHGGKLVKIGKPKKYSLIDAHRAESYITELANLELTAGKGE